MSSKPKWNEQPHSHICPLHAMSDPDPFRVGRSRVRCEVIPCPDPYVRVCEQEHPREMIQAYYVKITREHNQDLRDEQRGARDAYRQGREDQADESRGY